MRHCDLPFRTPLQLLRICARFALPALGLAFALAAAPAHAVVLVGDLAPGSELTQWTSPGYMDSTASAGKQVAILEGYAHLDPLSAADNEACR